jgi:hypothetical protein
MVFVMKKRLGANGSILGKTTKVVPEKDALAIYTTGTWIIILSIWVFAGAFFSCTLFLTSFWVSVILTAAGGTLGFLLSFYLYTGKLTKKFSYYDITAFISDNADFTIALSNHDLFDVRMMPKAQMKLLADIQLVMQQGDEFNLVKQHGRYVIEYKHKEKIETIDKK